MLTCLHKLTNDVITFEGHDSDALWDRMADVIVKTLLTTLPHNVHAYRESNRVLPQQYRQVANDSGPAGFS